MVTHWHQPALLGLLALAVLLGNGHAAEPNEADRSIDRADFEYFEKKIRPLLAKRCYQCHSADAEKLRGNLRLDSRADLLSGGDTGPAVVPGKPDESLLIESVRYGSDSYQMPPQGKLPEPEIAELENWVRRGAPLPESQQVAPRTEEGIDYRQGRQFWSFQPVARPALPEVRNDPWCRNRLDRFILARLESEGLDPSPTAERRTLIRRLSFDLVGLPPSPAEIEAFLADDSPDAYQRLVDRLLASPQFGQRWARTWLDLARYTDATASWLNSTAQAYLYRDWVVAAMNRDVPYDQFVRRQLATDLMPQTGPADIAALGFLGLSPTYWKELKLPAEIIKVIVADEWEERVDAVSRTFLGLTVACARCHDHKFDPISMEDYYSLASVIASTRLTERPIIPAAEYAVVKEAKDQVAKLNKQLDPLKKQKNPPEEVQQQIAQLKQQIEQIRRNTPHFDTPLANAVEDAALYVVRAGENPQSGSRLQYEPEPRDLPVFIRGNPNRAGQPTQRRFLRVLSEDALTFSQGSGRLELANAIVGDATPLAARVIVNRIWQAHFGRGLVDSPSNFGQLGDRPSHPELLDDLAAGLIAHDWSLKWLHRQIVLSATYRQSSAPDPARAKIDAQNRLLWRMNPRRLPIEAWRDAMLAASGELDLAQGGPATDLKQTDNRRRTLYGKVHRREVADVLRLHDFPDPTAHRPERAETTTPLQGLFVLNSPFVSARAESLARRVRREVPDDTAGQIQRAYRLLFGRPANEEQVELGQVFLAEGGEGAWAQYAQVLIGSNEFLYVD